jgi:hypothetical protein
MPGFLSGVGEITCPPLGKVHDHLVRYIQRYGPWIRPIFIAAAEMVYMLLPTP